jgi:hypothetical protein
MIPEIPESSSILHWLGVQCQVKTAGAGHLRANQSTKQEKLPAKSTTTYSPPHIPIPVGANCPNAIALEPPFLWKASSSVCVRIARYAGISFKFTTP